MSKNVGVALVGDNGHQITLEQLLSQNMTIQGTYGCERKDYTSFRRYKQLDDLLNDENVNLVSICGPEIRGQYKTILAALNAGKHVYAEKPCAMLEKELDAILWAAKENRVIFCEMAGTFLEEPYATAADLIGAGALGEPVQIYAQKSYPYGDWRPQNEEIDGGLLLQNAIYCLRFVYHVVGMDIKKISALETSLGNPKRGGLRMAVALQIELANGGIASGIANYLNQGSSGIWGNEELRVFGTKGFLITNPYKQTVKLFLDDKAVEFQPKKRVSLLEQLIQSIQNNQPLPFSMGWLTKPTRLAIQAKENARLLS